MPTPPDIWQHIQGAGRHTHLCTPPTVPRLVNDEMHILNLASEVLEHMRWLAGEDLPDYRLAPRHHVWAAEHQPVLQAPRWLTLKPEPDLVCWAKVLIEGLGCDRRSTDVLVELTTSDHYGFMEVCRLLHHLFKDKQQGPGDAPRTNAGARLKNTSEEAHACNTAHGQMGTSG